MTSTYYLNAYPDWVNDWNARSLSAEYANTSWKLSQPQRRYLFGDSDDRPWETDLGGFGRFAEGTRTGEEP